MPSGWIKLHRKTVDWEWYSDINVSRLFFHLLIKCNYEDKQWQGQTVKRGQFVTSLDKLSDQTGLTIRQIRTALKKLKTTSDVTSKTTNKYTVLTIEKYSVYQDSDNEATSEEASEETSKRQSNDKRTTTTKEVKKLRSKEVKNITCPEPSIDDSRPDVFIGFPTNKFNTTGELYLVTVDSVNEFKELYPAVDVEQQLRNMKGWLKANNRKTASGMAKFINSWLTKEQNRGGKNGNYRPNGNPKQSLQERAVEQSDNLQSYIESVRASESIMEMDDSTIQIQVGQ